MLSTTKSIDRISMMFSIIRQSCSLCENVKVCKEDVLFAAQLHESINAYDSNLHEMRIFTRAHASRTSVVPFLQVVSRLGNVVLAQRLERCETYERAVESGSKEDRRHSRGSTKHCHQGEPALKFPQLVRLIFLLTTTTTQAASYLLENIASLF